MANYDCMTRTNYFRVTDEKWYKELFERLENPEGDKVYDFSKEENGTTWHGFGTYGEITYYDPNSKEMTDMDTFFEEMTKILPDDDALILTEIGHEKLRYLSAYSTVVTHKGVEWLSLSDTSKELAGKILGNPKWTTNMCY